MEDSKKRVQEEPRTIAEIQVVNATDRNQVIAEEYNSCPLCGSELEFTHVTNFATQLVCEEAFCYVCNVSAKKDDHKLQ